MLAAHPAEFEIVERGDHSARAVEHRQIAGGAAGNGAGQPRMAPRDVGQRTELHVLHAHGHVGLARRRGRQRGQGDLHAVVERGDVLVAGAAAGGGTVDAAEGLALADPHVADAPEGTRVGELPVEHVGRVAIGVVVLAASGADGVG